MDSKIVLIFLVVVIKVVSMRRGGVNKCACVKTGRELVNECDNPLLNNCDSNATCSDLKVGFVCTCNEGFIGDGTFCNGSCNGIPCIGENRTCYRNESCLCTPGFHEQNDTCIEECEIYSNTSYNDYPGSGLFCTPSIAFVTASDLDACKTLCNNATGCISIGFDSDFLICAVFGCDPRTPGALFGPSSEVQTVSVRNCA